MLVFLFLGWSSLAAGFEFDVPQNEAELDAFLKKLRGQTLPQMDQIHTCYVLADHLADLYLKAKTDWLGTGTSPHVPIVLANEQDRAEFDFNLLRNFAAISASEDELATELVSFIEQFRAADLDKAAIRQKLQALDGGQLDLRDHLTRVSRRETLFLYLLDSAEKMLRSFEMNYQPQIDYLTGDKCQPSGADKFLAIFRKDLSQSLKEVERLKGYVLTLRPKRNLLIKRLFEQLRQRLLQRYADLNFENLSQVEHRLLDILRLDQLGAEMIQWWQDENSSGLADNRHLQFLQYERPLRDLRLLASQAYRYEQQIKALDGAPEESQQLYLNKLAAMQRTIERNLNHLESSGWQGQLNRQQQLNERRRAYPDRYSAACLAAVDEHLAASQDVVSIEMFRELEAQYQRVVELCRSTR
jgi:hypothetical protein